ncbi:FBD-like protein [Artemisia annua]|uniref:FBD-like protein n=1 Tax=Artemisia annua TaxID=35608 RepID=A0A2U1KG83_ARTAN|nr:FBD-like protein [Artemisia annua]
MSSARKTIDRLSSLPEELYSHILSLMPTKDAVFELNKTSQVNKFRMHYVNWRVAGDIISKWINKAVALYVCELDIRVFNTDLRSYGSLFEFISGCPILENLSLEISTYCWKKDYNIKIPTLKRLNMKLSTYKLESTYNFCLNVPNLEYLSVDGFLCSFFEMEDLSSLVEYQWLNDLPLPKFANLKRLELKGYNGLGMLPQFLESCSELKHLCIEKDVIDFWKEPSYIPTCLLMNLKTLKYTEHRCYHFDMKFLMLMLGNSKVLKMLTFKRDTNLSLKEKERIIKLPRASSDCEIRFYEIGLVNTCSLTS